jgi:hypothetical protein
VIGGRAAAPAAAALLRRAVAEGHELGNHMPADRSYARDDAAAFRASVLPLSDYTYVLLFI